MDIKPKIESLLESANLVTGQERDNLTDAIQDLVDGYGNGSGNEFTKISFADCVSVEVEL